MLFLIFICFMSVNAGPPFFENDNDANITATENSILKVRCSATGDPRPTYEWYNERTQKVGPHLEPPIWVESDGDKGSVLIFNVTSRHHSGGYTCVAQNTHGLRSKVYEVNIIRREEEADIKVLSVTDTSVKFKIAPLSTNVTYNLKYREIYQKLIYYDTFVVADKGVERTISRLLPSGLYSFNFSRKAESNQEKKWTLNLTIVLFPARPEVIFHKLNDGIVTFSWFRKSEDSMRRTIDKHLLTYRSVTMVAGSEWRYNDCHVSIDIPACAASQYTLADLGKNQWYEISVKAHTAAGYGEPYKNKIHIS